MKRSKKILTIILITASITIMGISVSAHSGRTDANGGHRDNQNKSGLGSYHYHCGGHPAHLHNNGICPYTSSTATQKSTKTTTNQGKTTNKTTSTSTNKTQTTSTSTTQNSTSSKSSNNQNTKSNKEQTKTAATSQESQPMNIDVTEIKIKEDINNIKIGESKKLEANIEPNNATDKTITWKTSDESIAKISNTGEIIGKKEGAVEITASSSNGKTSTIKINVEKEKNIAEENKNNNNISENKTNNTENTITNTKERKGLNPIIGIISLGALGGTGYLGYKKYKINKK